ncbi:MAG TPA: hypothetical protein VMI73_13535 [Trebonia sp.]|nr:hypothetical protein [Trebonia sp.]
MQRLVSSIEGPRDAPVLVLGNPIGTTRDVWSYQVPRCSGTSACCGA